MHARFTVNGVACEVECDPRERLLDVLRERLGLRGTKCGCGEGECGACSVLLDGRIVTACLVTAGQAHSRAIETIESVTADGAGRDLVSAFVDSGAVQCGFCTPGIVLAARALLAEQAAPDDEQIRTALAGHLCRCTGYAAIVRAVTRAAMGADRATPIRRPAAVLERIEAKGYVRPESLAEALRLLMRPRAPWLVLAGGTDLLVREGERVPEVRVLDIGALSELRGIRETSAFVHIGALTPFSEILRSPALAKWAPGLVTAAGGIGGVEVQNMATIGGNLVNASPAADSVPPLAVLDARLALRSARGHRTLPVLAFALGPGRTALAPDELLTEISFRKRDHGTSPVMWFEKVGPRRAQAVAKASVAMFGRLEAGRWRDVRIAMGAVGPTVLEARRASHVLMSAPCDGDLVARTARVAAEESAPIDDIRSTATYRRRLVEALLLRNLRGRIGSEATDVRVPPGSADGASSQAAGSP